MVSFFTESSGKGLIGGANATDAAPFPLLIPGGVRLFSLVKAQDSPELLALIDTVELVEG